MFRFPKTSNQSPAKKIVATTPKSQGLCKYPHRKCNLLSLENYEYCFKHILEDKTAPYKPCLFLYTVSGKKCGKPAFRPDRKDVTWFCAEHSRKSHILRQKASSRHAPPQTQEALLASLSHYARTDKPSTSKKEDNENEDSTAKQSSRAINPFVDVDAGEVNARCSQVLDCASDSDSDVEAAMLDSVWRAQDVESSDAESVDSQAEDPLKHAGVLTAEEVTVVIKDKMIRLQSLYIDQFRRLNHLLKERRRKYLHALKKEKETLCSINDQEKTSAKEQKLHQKLKALNHFHKYYGEEAVLHKKALERRAQVTEGTLVRTSHKGKCAFTEGGVKCGVKTLPVTKYCKKHILEDTQQVLFRACGFKRDDHTCQEPTLNVFENATCVYHITLPAQPHNTLDMSEAKGIKQERQPDQKPENAAAEREFMAVDTTPQLPCEDVLKPIDPSCMLKPTEIESPLDPLHFISNEPPLKAESIPPSEVPVDENVEMTETPVERENELKESESEKMDIDTKSESTTHDEPQKQENVADDLVMVDMMTDVGVVEEVLETEESGKPEVESVQLSLQGSDGTLGSA